MRIAPQAPTPYRTAVGEAHPDLPTGWAPPRTLDSDQWCPRAANAQ